MRKKYLKNSVTLLLITSFLLTPLASLPKKAEAQSIGAYTSGLIPAIAQLPLCRGKLTSATSLLFGQGSGSGSVAVDFENDLLAQGRLGQANLAKFNGEQAVAQAEAESIRTNSPEANKKLDELQKQLDKVEHSTASLDANDTCLKNIGRLVIKMLLQKITVSTVAWINGGFDGKPAFVQDPGKFFGDIAKNELLQFGGEFNDAAQYPFGREWLRSVATGFNNKFQDNARYSLNELIQQTTPQYSANSFQLDFSQGGWGAWSAMTQVPANNPLGFQLIASDELQRRLQGTQQSVAQDTRDALQAANGFLGDMRCTEPKNLSKQEDKAGRDERSTNSTGPYAHQICTGSWQYVTPGKLVADAATSAVNYPNNNLLKADDLNDAVAAILDALLSKFSSNLMEQGFSGLDDTGVDGSFVYNSGSSRVDYSSQTQKDFTPVALASSWLNANPTFNIRTDLTQALIDEQRTYIDKLTLQNKELNSTTDGKVYTMNPSGLASNAYGLIPAIDQLDYCIPGPHAGFEEDSRRTLDAVTNLIIPQTEQTIKNLSKEQIIGAAQSLAPMAGAAVGLAIAGHFAVAGATAGSAVPLVGTVIGAVVGAVVGGVVAFEISLFGDDDPGKLRAYYAGQIQALTSVPTDHFDNESPNAPTLLSKQGAVQGLNIMLERYIDLTHKVYNPKVLPSVSKDAAAEFNKLQGYVQMMANNDNAVIDIKNVVSTLNEIKDSVDTLNQQKDAGSLTAAGYEDQLKAQINAFGRVSASMVNGDDIASADNLLKQIVDEKNYVYNDLLKGPFGCEKDLELARQNMPDQLYATKRMNYPFPLLYTYNMSAGATIPDPWNSGFASNKTSTKATNLLGPGFLSFYSFQGDFNETSDFCKDKIADDNGAVAWCQIQTNDFLPLGNGPDWYPHGLGTRPATAVTVPTPFGPVSLPANSSSPFENSIGAY